MIVEFDKSFYRTLIKLKNVTVLKKVERTITKLEAAQSLNDVLEVILQNKTWRLSNWPRENKFNKNQVNNHCQQKRHL